MIKKSLKICIISFKGAGDKYSQLMSRLSSFLSQLTRENFVEVGKDSLIWGIDSNTEGKCTK
jgi:hypothetical protein